MHNNSRDQEEVKVLNQVIEKTKRNKFIHHGKQVFYFIIELTCYLFSFFLLYASGVLFVGLINSSHEWNHVVDISLGDVKELKDILYIGVALFLVVLSLFPLIVAVLIRRLRIKNGIINDVHVIVKKRIDSLK